MTKALIALLWLALVIGPAAAQFTMPGARSVPGSASSMTKAGQIVQGGGATVLPVCATDPGLPSSSSSTTNCKGSFTVNCGFGPVQAFTNNGALTLTAPGFDGSCFIQSTNQASASTITFSGFTVGSSTGAALTTTSGHIFTISVWRINGTSGYNIFAHQ